LPGCTQATAASTIGIAWFLEVEGLVEGIAADLPDQHPRDIAADRLGL